MTTEDKRLISEYMGWKIGVLDWWRPGNDGCGLVKVSFDLNDAGLCIKEMQRHGDWDDFLDYVETCTNKRSQEWSRQLIAWLYDPDNFFTAISWWLKEEKK